MIKKKSEGVGGWRS